MGGGGAHQALYEINKEVFDQAGIFEADRIYGISESRRSVFLYHKYNDKSEKRCYNTSVKNDKRSKKLPERKN